MLFCSFADNLRRAVRGLDLLKSAHEQMKSTLVCFNRFVLTSELSLPPSAALKF